MTMHTLILTDFHEEVELTPASRNPFIVHYEGFDFGTSAGSVPEYHVDVNGEQVMLSFRPSDRSARFKISANQSRAEALDSMTILRRWISGPTQQAARAELDHNIRPVFLKVLPVGATNYTIHRVRYGHIQEGTAHINPYADRQGNPKVLKAVVELVLYPSGGAENEIHADNVLDWGLFDKYDSGVGLGWTLQGTATGQIVQDKALVTRYSQKIIAAANNDGILSDNGVVPKRHRCIGVVWLLVESGTWNVTLGIGGSADTTVTGITAANIASKAEQSVNDRNGNTWYQIKLTQTTLATTSSAAIRVYASGAGTAYLDGVSVATVRAVNLTTNPDMEVERPSLGPAGWVAPVHEFGAVDPNSVLISRDDSNFFDGLYGMSLTFADPVTGVTGGYVRSHLMEPDFGGIEYTSRCWVRIHDDAGAIFRLGMYDGAGNLLDSVEFDESDIASKDIASATGASTGDGETWHLMELKATNNDAPGVLVKLDLAQDSPSGAGNPVIYVDDWYVYRGDGAQFDGLQMWGEQVYFRDDWDASNERLDNRVRIFGVPGDNDAQLRLDMTYYTANSGEAKTVYLSKEVEERRWRPVSASYEAELWQAGTGTWTTGTDDTSASGGAYRRYSTAAQGTGTLLSLFPPDDIPALSAVPRVVYAIARASHANATLQLKRYADGGNTVVANDAASFTNAATWELLELGPFSQYVSPYADYWALNSWLELSAKMNQSGSQTIDIDTVWLLPAGREHFIIMPFLDVDYADQIRLSGVSKEVFMAREGAPRPWAGSGLWAVPSGFRTTTLRVLATRGTANEIKLGTRSNPSEYMRFVVHLRPTTTGPFIGRI